MSRAYRLLASCHSHVSQWCPASCRMLFGVIGLGKGTACASSGVCLREVGEQATGLYSKGLGRCAGADWSQCDWSVQRCKRSE